MWLIAGPNGAGKSTFTEHLLQEPAFEGLIPLNADVRTAELRRSEPAATQADLNLRAAQQIDAEVTAHIAAGRSFLVETVLSSGKYRDDVLSAKAAGFKVGLIYISLHPPELSPLRVSERVLKGGHTVEPGRALARYTRSHAQLTWFAAQADIVLVYDNSAEDGSPKRIAAREASGAPVIIEMPGCNPAVDRVLAKLTAHPARKRPPKRST